jgi:hypothetical protein
MATKHGRSGADAPSGYSAELEPSCTVSAVPVSIPNALEVDCPRCHQTCGWCGDYRHMHGLLSLPGTKRKCGLPLSPEGDACPICHGDKRVRAVTQYERLNA